MICAYCDAEFIGRKYWHRQLHDYICSACKEDMNAQETNNRDGKVEKAEDT